MKQTAIEWLEDNIIFEPWAEEHFEHNYKCWDKAKEMEREQIIDFGYDIADDLACGKYRDKKHMEERYNEFLTYREEDDDI